MGETVAASKKGKFEGMGIQPQAASPDAIQHITKRGGRTETQIQKASPMESQSRTNVAISKADRMFKAMSKSAGFATPIDVFRQGGEKADDFLATYVMAAVSNKQTPMEIALSIIKYRYPAKLEVYKQVDVDQAASLIAAMGTGKIDAYKAFCNGTPIAEGGKSMNGVFGRRLVNRNSANIEIADEVADYLYLIKHGQQHDMPQPPWIMFIEKTRNAEEFGAAWDRAVEHRGMVEKNLTGSLDGHYFKVADPKHDSTTKFRMACVVFDMEQGKFSVVSGDRKNDPMPFSEWAVSQNGLQDILSCNARELEGIKELVGREGGLLDKLHNPKSNGSEYAPWKNLVGEVGGDYKRALQAWRYATITIQAENIAKFEANWEKMRQVNEILETVLSIGCDDSRQGKNFATLGALLTKKEFKELVKNLKDQKGPDADMLIYKPHYKCGFVNACYDISNMFSVLENALYENMVAKKGHMDGKSEKDAREINEAAEYEYVRNVEFFRKSIRLLLDKDGPVRERLVMRDYLPESLQGEYRRFIELDGKLPEGEKATDDWKQVGFLHGVFVSNDEMLRSAIRRGLDVRALQFDSKMDVAPLIGTRALFVEMPAAKKVQSELEAQEGIAYVDGIPDALMRSLAGEQVARDAYARYRKWNHQMREDRHLEIRMYADNFTNGMATVVPEKISASMVREDYFLKNMYTPEEIQEYKLEKWATWNMPA